MKCKFPTESGRDCKLKLPNLFNKCDGDDCIIMINNRLLEQILTKIAGNK